MYAFELFEAGKPRVIVTYPGRFQPFHQGHAAVYAQLQKQFGRDNVYILTSNDTSGPKSPFSFSDKYQLMTAAGVPGDRIIETTNMYALPEGFDKASTIFVAAVGEPDKKRLNPDSVLKKDKKDAEGNVIKPAGSPGYFLSFDRPEPKVTADQHGYVIVIPEVKKTITIKGQQYDVSHGTECRNLWNAIRNDQKARIEFLTQLYGRASNEIAHIFDKIPAVAEDVDAVSQDTTSPIHGGIAEDAAGVGVVAANKKMARDPRYSMSITKDVKPETPKNMLRAFRLSEDEQKVSERQMMRMVKRFMHLAAKELKLSKVPHIVIQPHIESHDGQATFGRFVNEEERIYLGVADRHPVDILRTLAHELVHFKQHEQGRMKPNSGETGSPIENEAHAVAGVLMRHFNKKYPDAIKSPALSVDENFADGRNPQDKGDSKRYNVPTKGSVSSLRKIAKQGGRRGQLAHWMANMKSGKKKND